MCDVLQNFSTKHIVNGICHHKDAIKHLQAMKYKGIVNWIKEQTQKHTCNRCGELKV